MKNHAGERRARLRTHLLATVGVMTLVGPLVPGALTFSWFRPQSSTGQTTSTVADRPRFDVASIRVSESSKGPNMRWLPGGLCRATASLRVLTAIAYFGEFTKSPLVFGGPSWVDSVGFRIEAKTEDHPGTERRSLLLQSLLEDRFQLVSHHESRQLPIYALVLSKLGKIGPQLIRHSNDAKCTDSSAGLRPPPPGPGDPTPAYCGGFFMIPKPGELREAGNGITMHMLGSHLNQFLDRPVVDLTRLSGIFDFTLEFAPIAGPGSEPGTTGSASDQPALPSMFTALEEQLGLKLESRKGPVDVIVIDHVEKPSEN
jgi:uncharacterized protein (TIGR03435 family)